METLISRSPTRVDLSGGTLDMWPIYTFLGMACTVNLAIDIWTEARLTPQLDSQSRSKKNIRIISNDLNLDMAFASLEDFFKNVDPRLSLYRPVLEYWRPEYGFTLETSSQSPVGGGLGGSSSLIISLLKVFSKWLGKEKGINSDVDFLVRLAANMEAHLLGTPTGTQDYYPAISGGMSIIHYGVDGVEQKILKNDLSELQQHLVLVYTGKPHHSGLNNWDVLKRFVEKESKTMIALEKLKNVSQRMAEACQSSSWDKLPGLFNEEYEWRLQLSPEFASDEIEKLGHLVKDLGVKGIKICGAGGGGCVLLYVPLEKRETVVENCETHGFTVLRMNPVGELS